MTAVAVTEAFSRRMRALTKNLGVRFLPAVYQQAQILTSLRSLHTNNKREEPVHVVDILSAYSGAHSNKLHC